MCPILFHFGPVTVYSYGLMFAVAVIAATWLLSRDAARQGISGEVIYDLAFWVVVSGIAGARVYYLLLYPETFQDNWLEIFMLQKGGLAFQGGFIAAVPTVLIFFKRKKLPPLMMLDLMAPYGALAHGIGRVGCFLNGCCFGREAGASVPWGLYFPVHDARLHPTQLYETFGLFVVYFILRMIQKRPHAAGTIFAFYLMLAGIERFIVEFFRADHVSMIGPLSNFQMIALGVFTAGLIMHSVVKIKRI